MCSKSAYRNKKNKEELEDRTPTCRVRIPGKILVFAERGQRTLKFQELA
jgi:hypothetical protein